jgi:hypothetical protein
MVELRDMTDADISGALGAWDRAYRDMRLRYGLPVGTMTPPDEIRLSGRIGHFRETDPFGPWVAV